MNRGAFGTSAQLTHYNHRRPHEGIALFMSANLFLGEVETVLSIRRHALNEHYARHPERYVRGCPTAARPPAEVWINPDLALTAAQLMDTAGALKPSSIPVEAGLSEIVS